MTRGWALGVLLACGALLALSAWLKPARAGMGTHQQLGLPPCNWVVVTGYPCPTCGMTTAFAHTVRGQWLAAIKAQPAGWLLAVATLVVAVAALEVLITGRGWAFDPVQITPGRVAVMLTVLLLLSWGAKILIGLRAGTLPVR